MNSSFFKELRTYWFVQFFVVVVLAGYVLFMGVGFYGVFSNSHDSPILVQEVEITLWVISGRPNSMLNFSTTSVVTSNITLIDFLNDTLGHSNWAGKYYGSYGWFITRLFNVSEGEGWFWLYYYRLPSQNSWFLGQAGVSHFILDDNYDIKFVLSYN